MIQSTKLSRRELEVLEHLQMGLTNRGIAESLGISANTVNKHVQQVLRKLRVNNRMLAVIQARGASPSIGDDRYLDAIATYISLNLVDGLRSSRIEYAEALDAQGRSAEAKAQWKLAALADRDTHNRLPESLGHATG